MEFTDLAVQSIKSSRFYHRYYCAKAYQRLLHKEGNAVGFLPAFFSTKPAFYRMADKNYALHRIERILTKSKIKKDADSCFLYSIDERCGCLYRNTVIENMPIDYSSIVKGSLEELESQAKQSSTRVAKQNIELISFLKKYIDSVCRHLTDDRIIASLCGMKNNRAVDLFDALQRILFINQILWQTGHKLNGLGRLDKILDEYEINDETEKLLQQFLKTLHSHYGFKSNTLLGDTGQLIILGGTEPDGTYFCNQYTTMFMQCLQKLQLPDPKILLRVSKTTPQYVLSYAAECIISGLGCPLLSNDDCIIPALVDFGYNEIDASNYGVSACWEPLVIGKSLEQNNLLNIEFAKVLNDTLHDSSFIGSVCFEEFFNLYKDKLAEHIDSILNRINMIKWEPDPILTLFTSDCLDSGRDIADGGAKYSDYGLLSVGLGTTVNSLINLSEYVYNEQYILKEELLNALQSNFLEYPEYAQLLGLTVDRFGTDSERAVRLTQAIIDFVCSRLKNYRNCFGGKVKFGLSSPDYLNAGLHTAATPDGRKSGTPFSTHISCDTNNAMVDVIHFVSKLRLDGTCSNGNVIDVMLQPEIASEKEKFVDYLVGSVSLGMFQAQFNVLSYDQLVDARLHPDKYSNLIVRVWGFSAYFNDLPDEYQEMIINRAKVAEGR